MNKRQTQKQSEQFVYKAKMKKPKMNKGMKMKPKMKKSRKKM